MSEMDNCPPECENGRVRVPRIYEEVLYGHSEKFVVFDEIQCGACRGRGPR